MSTRTNLTTAMAIAAAMLLGWHSGALAQAVDALVAKLPDSVKSAGVIKVGAPQTIKPHVFLDGDKLTGVAVDLANEIGPMLGVKFEWVDMQWPGIIPGLQSGAIDLSVGMISYKPDRKEILNMIPYINDANSLLVASTNTDITEDDQSLCGKKVGVVQASWFLDLATAASKRCTDAGKPAIEILQYSANAGVQAAFQSGSIDAWLHTAVELVAIRQALGDSAKIVNLGGDNWKTGAITMSTSKDQQGLAEALQGAMQKLVDDGRYKAILDKYSVGDLAIPTMTINP